VQIPFVNSQLFLTDTLLVSCKRVGPKTAHLGFNDITLWVGTSVSLRTAPGGRVGSFRYIISAVFHSVSGLAVLIHQCWQCNRCVAHEMSMNRNESHETELSSERGLMHPAIQRGGGGGSRCHA